MDIIIHPFPLPSVSLQSFQFFWCIFSFVVRKVRVNAVQRLDRGRNRKWLGRGEGEKAVTKTIRKWMQQMAFLIWLADRMSTCQQISGSHIYKLQRSTISCNVAYLICVHSKKYSSSVFMANICLFFLGFSPLIPHCWPFPQALRCGTSKKQRKSNWPAFCGLEKFKDIWFYQWLIFLITMQI